MQVAYINILSYYFELNILGIYGMCFGEDIASLKHIFDFSTNNNIAKEIIFLRRREIMIEKSVIPQDELFVKVESNQNDSDMQETEAMNQENQNMNQKNSSKQQKQDEEKKQLDAEQLKDGKIKEYGQTTLVNEEKKSKIHLISIIGEVEGHECLNGNSKATKYEHILPQLAAIEDSTDIDGLLVLLNTVGGDVEAGLAIAEMIASLSKPTVSLVLGGSHSIGGPLAVSTNYSFIVPTATMIIHPVRMNGTVIGVAQTFEYIEKIQERIISFVVEHSHIPREEFKSLMLSREHLAKDVGSILIGKEAVDKGMIDEVGGIKEALGKLYQMIEERKK